MSARSTSTIEPAMWIAMTVMAIVAMIGVVAWLAQGDTLFATLIQHGLAWCF